MHSIDEINVENKEDMRQFLFYVRFFCGMYLTSGKYFTPYIPNSSNMEQVDGWSQQVTLFLSKASELTSLGYHQEAVASFKLLFSIIDKRLKREDSGIEVRDISSAVDCYLTSANQILSTDAEMIEHVVPLLKIDAEQACIYKVYERLICLCTPSNIQALQTEIMRENISICKIGYRHH